MFCKLALALVLLGVEASSAEKFENVIPEKCKTVSVTPVSCAGLDLLSDGLLPHPDPCDLFYYCVEAHQVPVCHQCPAGLYFNPAERVCDQPAQAGCKKSQ